MTSTWNGTVSQRAIDQAHVRIHGSQVLETLATAVGPQVAVAGLVDKASVAADSGFLSVKRPQRASGPDASFADLHGMGAPDAVTHGAAGAALADLSTGLSTSPQGTEQPRNRPRS